MSPFPRGFVMRLSLATVSPSSVYISWLHKNYSWRGRIKTKSTYGSPCLLRYELHYTEPMITTKRLLTFTRKLIFLRVRGLSLKRSHKKESEKKGKEIEKEIEREKYVCAKRNYSIFTIAFYQKFSKSLFYVCYDCYN